MSVLQDAAEQLAQLGTTPFPLGPNGLEAAVIEGAFLGMKKSDWIVTGPRERVGAVLRGCPAERLADPFAGAKPYKVAPCSEVPGVRALHAVGLSLGTGAPVLCFLGPASVASGGFYEALNSAVLTGVSVLFLATTRSRWEGAPVGRQSAASLESLAGSFGVAYKTAKPTVESVKKAVAALRGKCAVLEVPIDG